MGAEIVKIRQAEREDAAALAAVHEAAWRSAYQGLIPHAHLQRMIARRGTAYWRGGANRTGLLILCFAGRPQGYVSFGPARMRGEQNSGEIFELYLAPEFQGVGLGKKLFLAARRELRLHGFSGLVIWALDDNEMACAFYEHMGGERGARAIERFGPAQLPKTAFIWRS